MSKKASNKKFKQRLPLNILLEEGANKGPDEANVAIYICSPMLLRSGRAAPTSALLTSPYLVFIS
jgi:hypothetical protein